MEKTKKTSFGQALFVIALMMATIVLLSIVLKASIITTFFIIAVEISLIGMLFRFPFGELEKAGYDYTRKAMSAFFILLSVGAMVAMWIAAGVVPTLIYTGLKLISPKIVLAMAMLLTSVAALATGTSYGAMATVGVAMMGIGASMNIPLPIVAGAVICGAFFGDSMSPCSDTTNITAAATQTPLMKEIRHMFYAQIPAYIISIVVFLLLGFRYGDAGMDTTNLVLIEETLLQHFNIGIVAVLPAVVVIVMLVLRLPTLLSLAAGVLSGAVVALLYQNMEFGALITFMQKGFSIDTGLDLVDKILNRGGIASMYDMSILMVLAMYVSGVLTHMGVMDAFIGRIVKYVKGTVSLIIITMILAYFLSAFAGSFTLASVITSTFMLPLYRAKGLRSENLARSIQLTSAYGGVVIPWNGHAVYAASTLGVATAEYLPYCFMTFLNPIILLILAFTGWSMTRYTKAEQEALEKEAQA